MYKYEYRDKATLLALQQAALAQGLDPRPFTMAIFAGCTAAMLPPTGSPSIAIAFGAGHYIIKNILKVFLPLWVIYGTAVQGTPLWVLCLFPFSMVS